MTSRSSSAIRTVSFVPRCSQYARSVTSVTSSSSSASPRLTSSSTVVNTSEIFCPMRIAHLNRDQRNYSVEQANHVQEPTCNIFRYDDRGMLVLRISLLLDVPVFKRADNVRFIRLAKLNLNFVPPN